MKTSSISIRRGLCLYKQPLHSGRGSPYWYARVYMKIGGRDVHARSTRTTDEREAWRQAEDFWAECAIRRRFGDAAIPGFGGKAVEVRWRFDRVVDGWLAGMEADAGSDPRRIRAYNDARKLCLAPNGLCAFFKRTEVTEIGTDRIREYLRFAAERSKKGDLAPTTKRNHISTLRGILRFAHEKGMIAGIPPMPKIRLKDTPRAWFEPWEYRALLHCAASLARGASLAGDEKAAAQWLELRDFISFMIDTLLRPSEWRELRQRHIQVVRGEQTYLKITVPNGKVRPRQAVSMPGAVDVFERIVERDGADPERFLFKCGYLNRQTAYERMRDSFEALLFETDLAAGREGKKRVLYSLRHTALMLRVLEGDVPPLLLATNAGTSVEQLERFYCSHLEPQMMVASLQSFKPRPGAVEAAEPARAAVSVDLTRALGEPAVAA